MLFAPVLCLTRLHDHGHLSGIACAGWFDRHFDKRGSGFNDSQSGLDLGDGLSINFLFAYLNLKYVNFETALRLGKELATAARLKLEAQGVTGWEV